ncbi:MAG: protealysin inhibitor emfourin [Nitrososphaerales archaeon]
MKIKIERSGGLAGITSSHEIDTDKVPRSLEGTIKKLLEGKKSPMAISSSRPKGSADYLSYKITIQNGMKNRVIDCNEFGMDKSVKSLISYVQNNKKK